MKAVILAGGFASRMWPLTKDIPKALLPVAGKPIIEYCIEKLLAIRSIETVYITTNKHFESYFQEWFETKHFERDVRLIVEEHSKEEEKPGSIGALKGLLDMERIDDDIIYMAGDNLLDDDLKGFYEFFRNKNQIVFGLHKMVAGELCKFGIACIDETGKVEDFEEKPENPKSDLVSTAIYALPREHLNLVNEYIEKKHNPDTPGFFISWLYTKVPTYGFVFHNKWFDIGSFASYREANEYMHGAKA